MIYVCKFCGASKTGQPVGSFTRPMICEKCRNDPNLKLVSILETRMRVIRLELQARGMPWNSGRYQITRVKRIRA